MIARRDGATAIKRTNLLCLMLLIVWWIPKLYNSSYGVSIEDKTLSSLAFGRHEVLKQILLQRKIHEWQ